MSSWNLRRYRDGDEEGIVELQNIAFREWHDLEYWKWKYKKNPAGSSTVWLATLDEKIIGHYGIIPVPMKVGNAYIKGSFSADAATHPAYQGQGVFSALVNRSYFDAAENDLPLTYALAKLGLTYGRYEWAGHVCFMVDMVKVLNWKTVLGRYIGHTFFTNTISHALGEIGGPMAPPDGNVQIGEISRFDDRIDRLWAEVSKRFTVIVRRGQTRLNWRYGDHSEEKYTICTASEGDRILGCCVVKIGTRKGMKLGFILDILALQEDALDRLVRWAVRRLEEQGVDAVACQISEGPPYGAAFRRAGFVTYPIRNVALKVSINLRGIAIDERGVYPQALVLSQNYFLKDNRNWFVTCGDAFE